MIIKNSKIPITHIKIINLSKAACLLEAGGLVLVLLLFLLGHHLTAVIMDLRRLEGFFLSTGRTPHGSHCPGSNLVPEKKGEVVL